MPRPRKPESPYQRRIRRYLEQHPGASRQEARGHKLPVGVRSEYQRRVAGTAPGSEARRRAAGHTGRTEMLRYIRPGTIIICDVRSVTVEGSGSQRIWREIPKRLVPPPWSRRDERTFVIRGRYTVAMLRALIAAEQERGAEFSPQPSLDQRRLLDY